MNFATRLLLPAVFAGLLLSGCTLVSDDFSLLSFEAPERPDTEPPAVVSTVPAQDSSDALRSQPIRIVYDEAIDISSFSLSNFSVEIEGINAAVDWVYDEERFTFSVIWDEALAAYVDVVATVPAGLADNLGHLTAAPFVLSYSTGPDVDTEPPEFAGVESAVDNEDSSVTLSWSDATDNVADASSISYSVYLGTPTVDFSNPVVQTDPGANSVRVPFLEAGSEYSFSVRAMDPSALEDDNQVVETLTVTGPTVEYAAQVQPIFTATCAGDGGCHNNASVPSGLDLSVGNSYAALVDQPSIKNANLTLVVPGDWQDSVLAQVITGRPPPTFLEMPLVGSLDEAEIEVIVNWIVQGAADN